jgi:uncharacterized LabA/DUF88 family protein
MNGFIMNNSSEEERLKIAVFIDFDNIAIGVKQSLNRNFDVGTVLEAIKEKGQVISKIAYGDWKRAEDFSRAMTQHAVQMVQRNLTPGGDKNGADIALALDALEMAFTRNHINAFVIVGGDSDFIALVEKLKQYDKTVFVVGGRAFTSVILQKNCHEFISYENLLGIQSTVRRSVGKTQVASTSSLETALPLIRRALKVLSDREVSPQLGLLKSTLLQLDSTFSERDFGVSSFRDFIQKLADAGYVNLKQVDRSLLVELKETEEEVAKEMQETAPPASEEIAKPAPQEQQPPEQQLAADPAEAVHALEDLLRDAKVKPHWPMYLRTFKQFIRSLQPPFEERQYGFSSTYELVRQAQKDGLLRVERNRQGILRIYPADRFPKFASEQPIDEPAVAEIVEPDFETPFTEPAAAAAEYEPGLQPDNPPAHMELPTETQEPLPEPEEESVTGQPEVIEEVVLEETPQPRKQKPRRGKRTTPPARNTRAGKARSRSKEKPRETGVSKA